jgi:hypothetical protein
VVGGDPVSDEQWCCRSHEGAWDTPAQPDSGFCRRCLAWLTERSDDDPLAEREVAA